MSEEVTENTPTDGASKAEARTDDSHQGVDSTQPIASLADPATLVDRDGVDFHERAYPHEDAEHCEADVPGRTIVGVTNDAGEVMLLVHEEGSHVVLPNCTVESDEDWAAVGRRTVEETTGVAVEMETAERVRAIDHVVDGDEEPHTTSYHVVFRASPAGDGDDVAEPRITDDEDWAAGWYDEIPVTVESDQPVAVADAIEDVRSFLD